MYYVIENRYVGPANSHVADRDYIEITTSLPVTNDSGGARLRGWLGASNDWSRTAYGQYASLPLALAAIGELVGHYRTKDLSTGEAFESDDPAVVMVVKRGRYQPISREATAEFVYASEVTAETDDCQIANLEADLLEELNALGLRPSASLRDLLRQRREDLRAEKA